MIACMSVISLFGIGPLRQEKLYIGFNEADRELVSPRDPDIVEKAFQSLKGIVKIRPIRHWLYNRVISHVFICYLSYLLLSLLKLSLKKINMSPVAALRELDTLYKIYIKDNKKGFEFSRTVALTKKQEKILKTIDKKLLLDCSGEK